MCRPNSRQSCWKRRSKLEKSLIITVIILACGLAMTVVFFLVMGSSSLVIIIITLFMATKLKECLTKIQWGGFRNLRKGARSPFSPVPSLSFPSSRPFPSFPLPDLPFALEVRSPLNHLWGLGERCKLPQPGPGRSSGRKRIYLVHSRAVRKLVWYQSF